jgi:DNA-binding MarR family transcriptional regulator
MNHLIAEAVTAPVPVDESRCEVPRAATTRLGLLLAVLGGNIEELAQAPLAELQLDGHDYKLLAILDADGPGTQHEIARLMNKAPGVIVAAVDKLESKGLVERQRDPADRRRSRVTPTPAGRAVLAQSDTVGDELVAEVLGGLSAAELRTLRELLTRGLGLGSDAC